MRWKPVLTPVTILLIKARVMPCSERSWRSSVERLIKILPSSTSTCMRPGKVYTSWPFGPLTVMVELSILISTPLGIAIGKRPIRDIAGLLLPDLAQNLAANAQLAGALAGHNTLWCGDN